MTKKRKGDWVVIDASVQPARFRCTRCGTEYAPTFPVEIGMFAAMGKAFLSDHSRCEERKEGEEVKPCG